MSDVRDLLDEATTRPLAHPDPVGAVHARVRRRAARNRAAVASGATLAVAAGAFAVLARPETPAAPPTTTPSPAASVTRYSREWRTVQGHTHRPGDTSADSARYDDARDRVEELVASRWGVFVAVHVGFDGGRNHYTFALGADVDVAAWSDELDAAAGAGAWDVAHCSRPAVDLDRVATEVLSAPFPSGATVHRDDFGWQVSLEFPCTVLVELDVARPSVADIAYARDRWGDAVRLTRRTDQQED